MRHVLTLLGITVLLTTLTGCIFDEKDTRNETRKAPAVAAPRKSGWVTRPSGLKIRVLREGTGTRPTAQSQVMVHYRGTLLNGKEFDSSYRRGQPATFGVGQVIRGWTEGLQLMRTGGKYELEIPSHLAYGQRGAPPDIGPNATLRFVVELLGVR